MSKRKKEGKKKTHLEKYNKIIKYCTDNRIFFQPNRIYGLRKGFFHFGDIGVRIKSNIKQSWFQNFVDSRDDIYSFEGTILSTADVWKGSGHEIYFDFIFGCKGEGKRHWYPLERLKLPAEIKEIIDLETPEKLKNLIKSKNVKCPVCEETLKDFKVISTMFKTKIGRENSRRHDSFLRPETCQDIFLNFKKVRGRGLQLPFGVAQIGKVFRNETTQKRRIFRCREFELMELEYFVDPRGNGANLFNHKEFELYAKSVEMDHEKMMKIEDLINSETIESRWLAYWIVESIKWLERIGIDKRNLRIRQHSEKERAHYSFDTWDVEYRFDWGWDEIEGVAYRKDYDMKSHNRYYKEKYHKKGSNLICKLGKHDFPYVIEISYGIERTLLAILYESYTEKKERPILKFRPQIAPYTVAVFPHKHRKNFIEIAREIYDNLKTKFSTKFHDKKEDIGRKYYRFDKLGVPFCISVGHEIREGKVMVSNRNPRKEDLVDINEVDLYIWKKLYP
ncbi:MAG: glycine--tRNA ligase [Theionarchaea archaeon]|nr:glycine--tRNA ligase [Theionarchaea archaeon]